MVRIPITPFWQIQLYRIYHLNCVVTGGLHIGQIFFFKVTYLCFKTSLYDYIYDDHCSSLLLKVSSVGSNALHRPCLHVQHCPPDHHRINLCHLLCDVGLQLVEVGMAWAVHLTLEILPEAEALDQSLFIRFQWHHKFHQSQIIHFMKMADVGFEFTTVFLVWYGFVKTVLLDFSPSTKLCSTKGSFFWGTLYFKLIDLGWHKV